MRNIVNNVFETSLILIRRRKSTIIVIQSGRQGNSGIFD